LANNLINSTYEGHHLLIDAPGACTSGTGECDLQVSAASTPAGHGTRRVRVRVETRCPGQTKTWQIDTLGNRTREEEGEGSWPTVATGKSSLAWFRDMAARTDVLASWLL
jgi:hypothetical protein